MDLKLIKNLLDMISQSDLDEVAIEEGNLKIKVKKKSEQAVSHEQIIYSQPPSAGSAQAAAPAGNPGSANETKKAEEAAPSNTEEIKSPIVGTFYAAANPESPDFVKVGQNIKKGDVLCIVEAMKIMNEIESEVSGKVVKIMVSNAQPVEFDQPLFLIEPN